MKNGEFNYLVKSHGFMVNRVTPYDSNIIPDNSIVYSSKYNYGYHKDFSKRMLNCKECMFILPTIGKPRIVKTIRENNKIIFSDNPRLEYAKLMIEIKKAYDRKHDYNEYTPITYNGRTRGSFRGGNVRIGGGTIIKPLVFIENNVKIGSNCIIGSGVKILKNVVIGNNVVIKANAVIGDSGFGVETDKDGKTYKIPHIGGVIIENFVEIGALSTVCSGTIEPTRIGKYTKIDDHVHIGHNVQIKESVLITACAEISRSTIKKGTWIGPNSSVIQGVTLGENSFIGIGSVVTKSVGDNETVAGNPAQEIEEFKKMRRKLKEISNEE
jgi:UDP-3-O-[3-hydroxymyristoyl] glucosamine N-acyltransferase